MCQKDVDCMANSVVPDQTAPLVSALFARAYLSRNLELLQYSNGLKFSDR